MDLNEDVVSKSRNAVDLSPEQNIVECGKRKIKTNAELLNSISLAPVFTLFFHYLVV